MDPSLHRDRQGHLRAQRRRGRQGSTTGLFDDVIGGGFTVISTIDDPAGYLSPAQHQCLSDINTRVVHIGGDIVDVEGKYVAYLAAHEWEVAVARPDFYVFGGGSLDELPAIIDELAGHLEV